MRYVLCEALRPDGSVWEDYIFPRDTVPEAPESVEAGIERAATYFRGLAAERGVSVKEVRFTEKTCATPEDYYAIRGPVWYRGGSPALDRLYGVE